LTNSLIISAGTFSIKKTSFQALIFLFPLLLERKSIIHFYTNFSAVSFCSSAAVAIVVYTMSCGHQSSFSKYPRSSV
ncbi:MAG: hypothetical protein SOY57_06765, partial [Ruminococcus bromii]|nr:hypothetical protein [Ruminococcus bromii]